MEINRRKLIQGAIIIGLFLVVLVYPKQIFSAFNNLIGIILPLILGGALAYVLNLLCRRLEKWYFPRTQKRWLQKSRRPVVIVAALVIILAVIFGVLQLVIPKFTTALGDFFSSLPVVATKITNWLKDTDQMPLITQQLESLKIDWSSIQSKVMQYFTSGVSGVFGSAFKLFGNITKGIVNFFLAVTFAIYILASKERLAGNVQRVSQAFVPQKILSKTRYVLHVANQMFSSFIIGQVTEAFVLGTLCVLGMLLFRFPYAVPIGAFIGIMALIPIFGAWIGAAVGFLLIVVDAPLKAVLFIVFILVLQQLENNLIYPRVVGTSIGLPGIWVLAAITIGSGVAGVLGMLLGVPIAATIYQLLRNATNDRLPKKKAKKIAQEKEA
ncbi:AI-2E family transporter [Loigolactobacillus zhaoyuanensis]|uniref:AI-2E family transporter n=1 Tax=Loigolactobacillus zhaoyuanensis TaxID=2486017 RepID=A0ABW8UE94_9LACO|nr:AI-2E family transporter [Loigolactobacillus zhaoyuanensis]